MMILAQPVVLGVNAAHDAAACLLIGGRLVAAIAEERLSRLKYHEGYPYRAVEYCLATAGLTGLGSVGTLVINQYSKSDYDVELLNCGFAGNLVVNPSHHLLHAYYAWVASGYRNAAILILDGSGYSFGEHSRRGSPSLGPAPEYTDMEEAESVYNVVDGVLSVSSKRWTLWEASDPYYRFASLGHMYSAASQYIFGHWKHAGKTMGLSAYGDPHAYPDPLIDFSGDEMIIDTNWVTRLPPRSAQPPEKDPVCRNVAAKVQAEVERAILQLVESLYRRTGHTRLAISGGVGLNSVTNGRILRESSFREVFITPAAGDGGIAIGAALYGHHQTCGNVPTWTYRDDYHGRPYSDEEIDAALDRYADLLHWDNVADRAGDQAAADLAEGRVVGWFEGGSEFGPRSLGHRSILCDPRDPGMRDHLNERVKFREPFRPYAASVLAEHASTYFDLQVDDPFMLVVAPVHERYRSIIPSVVHEDGTCRIQSVRPDHPGRFRQVIEAFNYRTGVPMVLNTSFNIRGEPIVETPADAIECFLFSSFEVLYIEGRRLVKVHTQTDDQQGTLVPVLAGGLALEKQTPTRDGIALPAVHFVRSRTGHRAPLSALLHELLASVDGHRCVDELASAAGLSAQAGRDRFAELQTRGYLAFRFPPQPFPA
jgi:carbamoyltransferase